MDLFNKGHTELWGPKLCLCPSLYEMFEQNIRINMTTHLVLNFILTSPFLLLSNPEEIRTNEFLIKIWRHNSNHCRLICDRGVTKAAVIQCNLKAAFNNINQRHKFIIFYSLYVLFRGLQCSFVLLL